MRDWALQKMKEFPSIRGKIVSLYNFAQCEIEEGGAYENEFLHFRSAVEELIEELA